MVNTGRIIYVDNSGWLVARNGSVRLTRGSWRKGLTHQGPRDGIRDSDY